MEKSQFSIQLKCIRMVGLINEKSPRLVKFISKFYPAALTYSLFSMLLFVARNYNDVVSSADALGPFTTGVITLSKFLSFQYYREEFIRIMNLLDSMADYS